MFNKKEYMKEYHKNNKEKLNKRCKQWRIDNPDYVKELNKQYRADNLEKVIEYGNQWRLNNPGCKKQWDKENREMILEYNKNYQKNKRKTDIKYNLNHRMSCSIWNYLRRNKSGKHWESLVNYTLNDLIKHLRKTIPKGYTWDD